MADMGLFSSKNDARNDPPRVEVHTNKRSYSWLGGPKPVTWEKGERIERAETKGFWGRK